MISNGLIIALTCYFIHSCTHKGMIFHKLTLTLYSIPDWIKKPLYACPICMTPYYGVGLWFIVPIMFSYKLWLSILIAGGINSVIKKLSNDITNNNI